MEPDTWRGSTYIETDIDNDFDIEKDKDKENDNDKLHKTCHDRYHNNV